MKKRLSFIFVFVFAILLRPSHLLPETIKIGGLFDVTDTVQEIAFRYAVDRVNGNEEILPQTRLTAQIERIPPHDSFYASKQVCKSLKTGVAGLFGPQSGVTSSHVQSICDALEIPHIETRWDYRLIRDDYSVNLYPHPQALGEAFAALIQAMNWKQFIVLYEESEALVRLQEVLKMSSQNRGLKITLRQLTPGPAGKDFRILLKDIKTTGDTHILLDCKTESIQDILKQAQQVGLMTAYHNYIVTSLDLHLVELEDFKYSGTNITAFRLVNPDLDEVQKVVQDWSVGEMRFGRKVSYPDKTIRTETALIYDAVQLFGKALTDLDRSQEVSTASVDCQSTGDTWQHGNSLVNYMKLVEMDGLTGRIKFDTRGFRSDFDLEIIELKKEGLCRVGVWCQPTGANFTRNYTESYTNLVESLHNKTLVVTTIMNEPYTMLKENSEALNGNDRYEGYNIDLIDEISKVLGFNYSIRIVADGAYGRYDAATDAWNGMIGELLSQKADLAVADLSITYEREQGVDFTMPFMNLGITILYTKPVKQDPNLFSFLSPLSLGVWIYMVTAYLAVSLLLYMLARVSPYERGHQVNHSTNSDEKGSRLARPDPIYETLFSGHTGRPIRSIGTQIDKEEEDSSNQDTFTLLNSFWFVIASLLQQGTDLLPRAVSTRMVAGMWWFFTLIMISSYTANLAAFLTVERMVSPIESAEDLSKQHVIKYGCVKGGSTAAFFRDSKIPTFSRMWVAMESNEKNFGRSNQDGVERVKKEAGGYAFLMESTNVEYIVERNCDLTQIGSLLDSKGYGIALPPNSPFRTPLSSAILQLQEGGQLHMLKEKWWKQQKGGGQCQVATDSSAAALGLANVGGVFVVLVGGLLIACVIALLEYVWSNRQQKYKKKCLPRLSNMTNTNTEETMECNNQFEPDHLTHLDLAAGIHHHNHNHNHSHHKQQCPGMISNLIFDSSSGSNKPSKTCMSSSLSTSFLNQSSCAVPTSSHFNDNKMAFSLQPSFSSNEIWNEMTKNGKNTSAMSFCSIHQKQCPQFYKDC